LSKPIAVLDSGVGGLTVVQELVRQLPREEIVYVGDTARCPYGSRSREEVLQFGYQLIDFLMPFEPKMLVIACNTATAVILEELRETSPIPVVGVIHPGARAAIKSTLTGRIGVIGTANTINSRLYEQALKQIHPQLYVTSLACPSLVTLVEEGRFEQEEVVDAVKEALNPLAHEEIDTLILGCTHYPLLAPAIQKVVGEQIQLISSADETAREVSTILFHKDMLSHQFGRPRHQFFTSGKVSLFKYIAESWLHSSVDVQYVHFEDPKY
jgi:glutamate racemase